MTPRYQWTPASEPPNSPRMVQAWATSSYNPTGTWFDAVYFVTRDHWHIDQWDKGCWTVTHWRDVQGPEAGA